MIKAEMTLTTRRAMDGEEQKQFQAMLYQAGIETFGDRIEFDLSDPEQIRDFLSLFRPLHKYAKATFRIHIQ